MLLEDQRFIHEDLERLEQAIAERVAEEPRNVNLAHSVPLRDDLFFANDVSARYENASLAIMQFRPFWTKLSDSPRAS